MKKLLTILCIIISFTSFGQIPVVTRTNGTTVPNDYRLKTQLNFNMPVYLDTTNANMTGAIGNDSCGAIIFTYTNNLVWVRACSPKRWINIGSGSLVNDTVYVKPPLYVYIDSLGHKVIAIQQQDGIIGTCPVIWDSLLVFHTPPCNYVIGGNYYSSPFNYITLDSVDATNPRYDLFIVDTFSRSTKITGVPSPTPTIPQADPSSQLALTSGFLVNPGDTVPNKLQSISVWDENLGVPTEWALSTTGTLTENANNTDKPKHLTKAIFVSKYNNGSSLKFLSASTDTVKNGQVLSFWIYLNGALNSNYFRISFLKGSTAVTNSLNLRNIFGLNPNDSNVYQPVAIPLSVFNWTGGNVFDGIRIQNVGTDTSGAKGYYLDWITLQTGILPIPSPTDYSNKQDSNSLTKTVVGSDTLNVINWWVKGIPHPLAAIYTHSGGGNDSAYVAIGQSPDSSYATFQPINRSYVPDTLEIVGVASASTPNLQQVTDVGNITTRSIYADSLVGTSDANIHGVYIGRGLGSDTGNTIVGNKAGVFLTPYTPAFYNGSDNTLIGWHAGDSLTTGYRNIVIGSGAFESAKTLTGTVAIGWHTLQKMTTTGNNNIGIGNSVMSVATSGQNNVSVGASSMSSNISGSENIAIGTSALNKNTTGGSNVAFGTSVLGNNTTGSSNIAMGQNALGSDTSGQSNVAIGREALQAIKNSYSNTAVGRRTLDSAFGNRNTAIGDSALWRTSTGDYNIGIGYNPSLTASTNTNSIAIGTNAIAASYQLSFSDSLTSIHFPQTATPTGTTGAQTINKAVGSVNFAAGASTLVVTNTMATTTSQIMVTVYGTDATATSARVTRASGSFTITLNAAATAETAVGFWIID